MKKLLLLLLLPVLLSVGCKNSEEPEPTPTPTPRMVILTDEQALYTVKERTEYSDEILYQFKGRIEKDGVEYFHV